MACSDLTLNSPTEQHKAGSCYCTSRSEIVGFCRGRLFVFFFFHPIGIMTAKILAHTCIQQARSQLSLFYNLSLSLCLLSLTFSLSFSYFLSLYLALSLCLLSLFCSPSSALSLSTWTLSSQFQPHRPVSPQI